MTDNALSRCIYYLNRYKLRMKYSNYVEFWMDHAVILFQSSLIVGVLLLFLTDALAVQKHKGCLTRDELEMQARRLQRRTGRHNEHRAVHAVSSPSCSDFTHWVFSSDLKNRSLSPWRSRWVSFPKLLPQLIIHPRIDSGACFTPDVVINFPIFTTCKQWLRLLFRPGNLVRFLN